jgi:hypothetical protein
MVGRRGKIQLQWITNRGKRNDTLKRRLPNLVKKTGELSVL